MTKTEFTKSSHETTQPRIVRTHKVEPPIIPTHSPRHIGTIREGKISFEIFSRANREAIPVDPDVEREVERGRGKEMTNAEGEVESPAEVLLRGREAKGKRDNKSGSKKTRSTRKSVQKDAKESKTKERESQAPKKTQVKKTEKTRKKKYVKRQVKK